MNRNLTLQIVLNLGLVFCAWTATFGAGDLNPTSAPAPNMHSLEEIYNVLNAGTVVITVTNIVAITNVVATSTNAPVEKSGQTTSYATGDDGDLEKGVAWPSPRFTDNGDGTVTDGPDEAHLAKERRCVLDAYLGKRVGGLQHVEHRRTRPD